MSDEKTVETKHVLYLDNLQRLIMAELIVAESNALKWVVKNPIILHVQSTNGQINIQFFPVMFREFQADKDSATVWEINTNNITPSRDIALDARLIAQYKHIFAPVKSMPPVVSMGPQVGQQQNMGQPPQQNNANVIKLFDE